MVPSQACESQANACDAMQTSFPLNNAPDNQLVLFNKETHGALSSSGELMSVNLPLSSPALSQMSPEELHRMVDIFHTQFADLVSSKTLAVPNPSAAGSTAVLSSSDAGTNSSTFALSAHSSSQNRVSK